MRIFHCDHCGRPVFFENTQCVACGHALAYLPDLGVVGSLDADGDDHWRSPLHRADGRRYRLCGNFKLNVCNWALPADDPAELCASCRLTQVIPDLTVPGNTAAWYRLEVAKRRLIYTLSALGLTPADPAGLAFEFRADPPDGPAVMTGHDEGLITVNLAEADDAERERRRALMNEPARTLLGHFRHESGHYYWDRLLADGPQLEAFRERFGDERADYAETLAAYHREGPPADWPDRFVSAYATAHPWEDWAETWAHYLHMIDTLETAASCEMARKPPKGPAVPVAPPGKSFDRMLDDWLTVTYVLNNLNRGLGVPDGYPYVLSPPAIAKMRFVHDLVTDGRSHFVAK